MKRITMAFAAVLVGCSNPLEIDVVPVDVTGDPVVSPSAPGEFRVSVENHGTREVAWGMGSSACQLDLAVVLDDRRVPIGNRVCTADVRVHALDPGGSLTETIPWGGQILVDNQLETLPAGPYRIVGLAGDRAVSPAIWVEVDEVE
jgi:hypothetical protein